MALNVNCKTIYNKTFGGKNRGEMLQDTGLGKESLTPKT